MNTEQHSWVWVPAEEPQPRGMLQAGTEGLGKDLEVPIPQGIKSPVDVAFEDMDWWWENSWTGRPGRSFPTKTIF